MKDKISFFIILILSSIFLFVVLTPKIAIRIFPFLKEKKFNQFKNYLLKTKDFDPQVFWQFREFYCPGYFIFKREGISIENNSLIKMINFLKNLESINLWFAQYNCPYLKSYEGLTGKETLIDFLDEQKIKKETNIIRKTNEFIFFQQKNTGDCYIIFLLNSEKMKKAVGFFDYGEKDVDLVKNKKWLDITHIYNTKL